MAWPLSRFLINPLHTVTPSLETLHVQGDLVPPRPMDALICASQQQLPEGRAVLIVNAFGLLEHCVGAGKLEHMANLCTEQVNTSARR